MRQNIEVRLFIFMLFMLFFLVHMARYRGLKGHGGCALAIKLSSSKQEKIGQVRFPS
jgi:hypothetical protein